MTSTRPTLLVALLITGTLAAQQPARPRTEALARRATERLQALQREADRLATEARTLLGDLRRLELERQMRSEELRDIEAETADVAAELAATDEQMRRLEQEEVSLRPEVRARLIEIYKLGRGRYARLLLSTPDLKRIGEASRTIAVLAKLDRDVVDSHQRTIAALRSGREGLEERRQRLQALRAEAQRAREAADRAALARADLIRDIDRRRDLNAQLAGELQDVQQKLQLTLRDLARGADVEPVNLPLRPFRGELEWPVAGPVRSRFGPTAGPRGAPSNGIEIAAPEGSAAQVIHDGLVAFADTFSGFGNLVIVDHGNQTFSLYGQLLDIGVKRGSRVDRGQAVGRVGTLPAGPAGLYFEMRVDGQPVDPLQWLRKK